MGSSEQRRRNSWPRSWIHLLPTHLLPINTGQAKNWITEYQKIEEWNIYQHVVLYNHLNKERTELIKRKVRIIPSPDAYRLYQNAALPFLGLT